jgi:hypothetical protein
MNPVIEDQPAEHEPAMPIFTGTLTKAQAQALMKAHEIPVLLEQEDSQLLIQDNPTLAGAYITLALIADHGK